MNFSNYTNEQLIKFTKEYKPTQKVDLTPLLLLEASKRGIELPELEANQTFEVGNSLYNKKIMEAK